ncbi:MAG: endopeptidase La [Spirochaetales bacterium]|nr:endopeptidase La [Spirochaetales bacterium]
MNENKNEINVTSAPVLALTERPLFPETFTTLMIARPEDTKAINYAIEKNGGIFVAVLKDEKDGNLKKVGTLAKVSKFIKLPNNCIHVFVSTLKRVTIDSIVTEPEPLVANVSDLVDKTVSEKVLTPYVRILKDLVTSLSKTQVFSFATEVNISNFNDADAICWYAASSLVSAPKEFLEEILESTDPKKRVNDLTSYIAGEKEILDKEEQIKADFINRVKSRNKEAILREQIRVLTQELNGVMGNDTFGSAPTKGDIFQRAATKKLPQEYREVVDRELQKLMNLDPMNAEYMLTKVYVETILDLPFSFEDIIPDYSITKVKEQLEKDHYGMKEVKERIVEFLASRLKAQSTKGAIICLAGPPGVGKTSVASSIAKALNKKFYRFSVGGMRDEAEIKGHRRTYIGALPGKLIQAIKTVKTVDPVILIDEIDKMGESVNGDPASALLEVLDPEQNVNFRDLYLDLPYDLSKVLFIVTANDLSRIPRPLYDRMEVIEMEGYTPQEKIHIGKEYLVPDLMKKNGLKKREFRIDEKTLGRVAEEYAREAGVRQYKNQLDKIMRKVTLKILETPEEEMKLPVKVSSKDLKDYLGLPLYPADDIRVADSIGMAMGLAWTSAGGDVIPVEAVALPQKGEMKITGQLGDVMKESVSIAFSRVKEEAYLRGLDISFFENHSVHLHCPEGAVPKDGPSAGITLFTALWSMYREVGVKEKLAMTGELTLTGKVEAIGGLKEKILGARRNGIQEIIIPFSNIRDLEKLDDEVKGDVVFHPVKDIQEVIAIAFPSESTHRLSKEELVKLDQERKEKEKKEREEETFLQAEAFGKAVKWQ